MKGNLMFVFWVVLVMVIQLCGVGEVEAARVYGVIFLDKNNDGYGDGDIPLTYTTIKFVTEEGDFSQSVTADNYGEYDLFVSESYFVDPECAEEMGEGLCLNTRFFNPVIDLSSIPDGLYLSDKTERNLSGFNYSGTSSSKSLYIGLTYRKPEEGNWRAQILGSAWWDVNRNGQKDSFEKGFEGLELRWPFDNDTYGYNNEWEFYKTYLSTSSRADGVFGINVFVKDNGILKLNLADSLKITNSPNLVYNDMRNTGVPVLENSVYWQTFDNVDIGIAVDPCQNNKMKLCTNPYSEVDFCLDFCLSGDSIDIIEEPLGVEKISTSNCYLFTATNYLEENEEYRFIAKDNLGNYDTTYVNISVRENCLQESDCKLDTIFTCTTFSDYFNYCPDYCEGEWMVEQGSPFDNIQSGCWVYDGSNEDANVAQTLRICDEEDNCKEVVMVVETEACEAIWPGDTNNDGIVNMEDLLQIGLGYGAMGASRHRLSNGWYPQLARGDWEDVFIDSLNLKYADCNGNGVISIRDTTAIINNYSEVQGKTTSSEEVAAALNLYFEFPSGVIYNAGDSVTLPLYLGSEEEPVEEFYGATFTLEYDTDLTEFGTFEVDFIANSWLGTPDSNVIYLTHPNPLLGTVDIGITRIDHVNSAGHGQIAEVSFVLIADILGKDWELGEVAYPLGIKNVKAINNRGEILPVGGIPASLTIQVEEEEESIMEDLPIEINMYPNPAKEYCVLESSVSGLISRVSVFDLNGRRLIYGEVGEESSVSLDVSSLYNGVYLVKMELVNGEVEIRKLNVAR